MQFATCNSLGNRETGRGRTHHGGEDGSSGEERAAEALPQADGDGEGGYGGRVRRWHPARSHQLLRVPPVLLVPARGRSRHGELRSNNNQLTLGSSDREGGTMNVPGGEDLDGLGDGEGEHRGDERAVGEHGQVGERGRAGGRRRRLGGGGGHG